VTIYLQEHADVASKSELQLEARKSADMEQQQQKHDAEVEALRVELKAALEVAAVDHQQRQVLEQQISVLQEQVSRFEQVTACFGDDVAVDFW
jgi:tRNA U34 5-carboxymethylaminomethyl modifying GTPase MnmE/TrmE